MAYTINSCKADIHEGDVGTNIDVTVQDCGVDVAMQGGDSVDFLFKKPDGETLRVAGAVVDPPSEIARYVTEAGDLDQVGRWKLQLALNIASQSWEGHSCQVAFDVLPAIDA